MFLLSRFAFEIYYRDKIIRPKGLQEVVHTSMHPPAPYKNFVSGENKKSSVLIPYHDR
jgi:hypothetical protein